MEKIIRYLLFILVALLSLYLGWSLENTGISSIEYHKLTRQQEDIVFKSLGYDRKAGNIVGIQPEINILDYSSVERFYDKMESYIIEAKRKGFIREKTIVVYPEHIGSPLVLLGEKREIYFAQDSASAFSIIAWSRFPEYARHYLTSFSKQKKGEAVFKMKSQLMKDAYQNTFKKLSAVYGIYIIAGSIILSNPTVKDNTIITGTSPLVNAGFLFDPNGEIYSYPLYKKNLMNVEVDFGIKDISDKSYLIWNNIGILFSKDSLYASNYDKETFKNIEVLISPSAFYEKEEIDWASPEITSKPAEEAGKDSALVQNELWAKYSVIERVKALPAGKIALQVFLRGKFYELNFEGESSALIKYVAQENAVPGKSAIFNIWF